MVDGDQRLVTRHRQRLGGDEADHDPPDQPWPGGGGDGIAVGQRQPRFVQHRFDQRGQLLGMGASGDLRHDAAVRRVGGFLRGDALRENAPVARHQGRGSLVAAALDPQNNGFGTSHPGFP